MKTEQEFWDDAILAAVSNMAGHPDYGDEFPDMLVNDAERIADALTARRQVRLVASKKSVYEYSDFAVSGSGRCFDSEDYEGCPRCGKETPCDM